MVHVVALVMAVVLNATANLMIRAGARAVGANCSEGTAVPLLAALKAGLVNPWIIAGVVCFALDLVVYTYALTKLPVSLVYPIMVSVSYAVIICVAMVWFSEKVSAWQIVGVGVIMVGVWLVASGVVKTA